MIEEKFELIKMAGSPDDAVVDTKCKECGHDFVVHTHILKTKNCEYDLGKSLTVICPQCNVRATTTTKEANVRALERCSAQLRSAIRDYIQRIMMRFKCIGVEPETLSLKLECGACGTEFSADADGGLNSQQQDRILIKCPLCGLTDTMIGWLKIVAGLVQLKKVETVLAELKNGPETLQA